MDKKNALALGAALLLCALALFIGLRLNRGAPVDNGEPLYLLITVDGQAREPILIEGEGTYTVSQGDAVNVVRVTKDEISMASSTCRNQDCVRQGAVTRENRGLRLLGNQIICLPNKVTLQLCTRAELSTILTLD